MPAAAVIPAPIAYINVAAVKTLVVVVQLLRCSFKGSQLISSAGSTCQNLEERLVFQAIILTSPAWYSTKAFGKTCHFSNILHRNSRGYTYLNVRGEILRPLGDDQMRKHSPSDFSLIKNESQGIEDDQIPS